MGKYDSQISRAKIILTEINSHSLNANDISSSLKLRRCMNSIYEKLPLIEEKNNMGFLGRFKDAMFETKEDRDFENLLRDFINDTAQLEVCRSCKCSSCVLMDESCACKGCVYGAYVTACGEGVEIRDVKRDTVSYNGKLVSSLKYDRITGQSLATVVNKNGTEESVPI